VNPCKVFAFNLGSTSTKVVYYEDDQCVMSAGIAHPPEQIASMNRFEDQLNLRRDALIALMDEHGIKLNELDSITTRGGLTQPIVSGTYRVSAAMVEQASSGRYGQHVCNLGPRIAFNLCKESDHAVPLTTDVPTTDDFEPLARYSGLRGITRTSLFHALNQKAMSRFYAESIGKCYEELNLICAMLGGGISVVAHRQGRMIDGPNAVDGEGAFSNNRSGSLPVSDLIRLCFSGEHNCEEMLHLVNGEAGLLSYLGTMDVKEVCERIDEGDAEAAEVLEAMCYQTAKEIGAYATVLEGKVDAIILTGGVANSAFVCERIGKRVNFIAPVIVLPGEREMESLALNSYRALTGQIPIQEFVPRETV
jgi:butyrate kinase